jgi:aryl-alcohol dehydrogenase-like predicted oxidoreductase
MIQQIDFATTFTLPGSSSSVSRMGYGAMQLSGKDGNRLVWGPPRDVDGAIAVLREAVASGVNHIDTSDARVLQRSPNILVIPGTSSVQHLRENLQAATLQIPTEVLADLDAVSGQGAQVLVAQHEQ